MVYGDRHVMREHEQAAPAVFRAEHIESEEQVPETVYLPSQRATRQDEEVTLELRDTAQGDRALLAFTSLRELVDGCGDGQAWVAVRGHQIDDLRARSGADVILWDAALPVDELRTRYQEGAR
ncbi:SAV_915 family protein [Saccharopolyspora gloriosae]|uniref:SAV_915 family protein n=1 Tax=Saccharopolyspora gloriosae TaxID=455344 RepID=UPI001FB84297|nr:SAV_915 family protein [Saccharopolyspora gloriosae]